MRKGFTLIELLVVTAIVGLLSTVGTVSYTYVRTKGRDTKRIADIRTLRNAIETYYEFYSMYPNAPFGGLILGSPNAMAISSVGVTPSGREQEPIFLIGVPSNVEPGGVPYVYRTRNQDGSSCTDRCYGFTLSFALESDIGDYKAGPHRLTETTLEGPEGNIKDFNAPTFLQQITPTPQDLQIAYGAVQTVASTVGQVTARSEVQTAGMVAAPISIAAAFTSLTAAVAAAAPLANAGQIFIFFFSQPLLILGRRRRETWGTVYHSGKKTPIDLAAVRLIDAKTNRLVATKVTDANGRYSFTPPAGSYRIEAVKPGFAFPATSLADVHDDGKFTDIYHGTLVNVETDGQTVTLNVPMDSIKEPSAEPRDLIAGENKALLRRVLAASGPTLGFCIVVVRPSLMTGLLFILHIAIYQVFKRLAEPVQPKSQGIVYDAETKDPVGGAVVRVLSMPYHKVLETRLTDAHGRYHFYVGPGKYEVMVLKDGYDKTETNEIDMTASDKPSFIAADLPLRRQA